MAVHASSGREERESREEGGSQESRGSNSLYIERVLSIVERREGAKSQEEAIVLLRQ